MPHQGSNAVLSLLSQLVEEDEKENHTGKAEKGVDIGTEKDTVKEAVGKDRRKEDKDKTCDGVVDTEMVEAVVIAHKDSKKEVSRDGEERPHDAGADPGTVVNSLEEIEDILESGKTHTDTNGIDDTVEVFVKEGVLSQQQPEQDELCRLFGDGCQGESIDKGTGDGRVLFHVHSHAGESADGQAKQHGQESRRNPIKEGFDKPFGRLGLLAIFVKDVPQQHGYGSKGGKYDKECLHKYQLQIELQKYEYFLKGGPTYDSTEKSKQLGAKNHNTEINPSNTSSKTDPTHLVLSYFSCILCTPRSISSLS